MIQLLFPRLAFGAQTDQLHDLAPSTLVAPGLFLVVACLALAIALLRAGNARAQRSLALS